MNLTDKVVNTPSAVHSSEFDFNGVGVAGKSSGDPMVVPEHRLTNSNGKVILELL